MLERRDRDEQVRTIKVVMDWVGSFEAEAHSILARYETSSKSRLISIDQTRRNLNGLSVQQQETLGEALSCIEHGLFRAAHVLAWQAFIDYLEEKLSADGLVKVKHVRPNWSKFSTIEDVRETISEYQIIEAARDVSLLSKGATKSILGNLSTRNECAHPSKYRPGLNESLGYVSGLIQRIAQIELMSL